jgi:hypothetical protein
VRALLVVLSLLEIVLVVAVLAGYLVAVARSLRRTAVLLGKVAFGVRAIERQVETVGAAVPPLNDRLTGVSGALADLASLAGAPPAAPSADAERRS